MNNWKERMASLVEGTLNENRTGDLYTLTVHSEKEYALHKGDNLELHTVTSDHLPSHWKEHSRTTVNMIITERFQKVLSSL